MKLCVIVLSLCLLSVISFAQKLTSDSLEILTGEQNFLKTSSQKIDSLQTSFFHSRDSLKQHYYNALTRIDSAERRLRITIDNVGLLQTTLRNSLSEYSPDSLQEKWKAKTDSLTLLNRYASKVENVLDSIRNIQQKIFSDVNAKLQSMKDKTFGKLNNLDLPPELSDKLHEASKKINEFQLHASDFNIPELGMANDLNLVELQNLDLISAGDLSVDNIGKFKGTGDGNFLNIGGDIGEHVNDLHGLTDGNSGGLNAIQDLAESKAEELSGLGEIKDQIKSLDELKGLTERIKNLDSLKEFAIGQAKEIAIDHFSGKEEQLSQAMQTLAKYKSKYPNLNSISEITKRPPNEMKGKPLIERIVPGIGVQNKKRGNDLMVDFNPYAAYRLTGRISAGLGWNERLAYNFDQEKFNTVARIYGPRLFGEFKMCRGFSPRAEIEVMNTSIPPLTRTQPTDPIHRGWVWGAFAGIKKEYKLIKNVKGTASVMMRLYNADRKSPYADVVNVRFGFEFPMKKKPLR